MKPSLFLNSLYGFGILVMSYFIYNEWKSYRLRFNSLATIIPSLEARVTGSSSESKFVAPRESLSASKPIEPSLADDISSWVRDDPYPPIRNVVNPYDRSAEIKEPTVTTVGWWGGEP